MDLLPLPQLDPPSSQSPGSCMTHSQPLRFSPGRADPPSPAPSTSPASSMHPPGFSDLVASLDGSIPHSSSWIPARDLPGSWAPDLRPSRVPAVGTRGAHGEELGSGREWTCCETPQSEGKQEQASTALLSQESLIIPAEPCYPGRASLSQHSPLLFLHRSQWRLGAWGNMSGTMQGHPDSAGLMGSPFP